ncbi:hypothetical protein DPMN_099906 [Dreissena polymorpha]|uniref:RING-type domain-containing protein n=1 Tax=Dreissena polymorpha TaxID=45954 RepID=A0A9D4LEX6_DREPO|nr:hypothetical protein DPMN_099906 [Dreissena polymorpha]
MDAKSATTVEFRQYKNIAEHFTCPIHLGKLRDPRRLACEHTFCADCLNGCINSALSTRTDGMFECPVCRSKHHVPNNKSRDWARGFPIDAFCVIQLHTLSQYEQSSVCEKHIQKFKEYFCFHHRELLCSDCVIEKHTKAPCSCGSLQDSITEVRLQIKELLGKLRLQEERARRIMESQVAASHADELLRKISDVEKTLVKFYKSMKAKIRASKQQVAEMTKISQPEKDHVTTLQSLIARTREHVENVIRPEKKRKDGVNEMFSIWTPLEHETQNFDQALDDIETKPYCVGVRADEQFLKFISYDKSPLVVARDYKELPATPSKEKTLQRMTSRNNVIQVEPDTPRMMANGSPEVTTIPSPVMATRTMISLTTPALTKSNNAKKLYDFRPASSEDTPRHKKLVGASPVRLAGNSRSQSMSHIFPKIATGELINRDTGKSIRDPELKLRGIQEISNFELPCGDILLLDGNLITIAESSLQKFSLDYKYIESLHIRFPWRLCAIKDTANVAINHNTRFISIVSTDPSLQILYRIETEKPYSQICHMRTQILEDRFGKTKYHEYFALSHTTDLRADCVDLMKVSYDKNPFSNFTSNQVTKLVPLRTRTLISSDKHAVVRSPNALAATADGRRLIIGGESAVVCVRKTGEILWTRPVIRFVAGLCCDKGLVFVCIENERKLTILDEAGNNLIENLFPLGCNIVRPNRVSVEHHSVIVREFSEKDWKSTVHVFTMTM